MERHKPTESWLKLSETFMKRLAIFFFFLNHFLLFQNSTISDRIRKAKDHFLHRLAVEI